MLLSLRESGQALDSGDSGCLGRRNALGQSFASQGSSLDGSVKPCFSDFYKLEDDQLGSGAYACVRTATSLITGKEYAVKVVDKWAEGHTLARLLHEVAIFEMCIGHPNIVQLMEWFEDDDYFYMVFEKMHGGQLLSRIQLNVSFTENEAALVTKDIVSALKFLHDHGVAHRDLKPENILCADIYSLSPVKLCDLDLASKPSHITKHENDSDSEPDQEMDLLESPVGSAEFMAPEVVGAYVGAYVGDSLKYDKRCDMWSLGVIIYIMLCGYPPFYGDCDQKDCGWAQGLSCDYCQTALFERIQKGDYFFLSEDWADISDEAKDLIEHLLVREADKRFTTDEVLKHPWFSRVSIKPNTTILQSPTNLYRKGSQRNLNEIFKDCQIRDCR